MSVAHKQMALSLCCVSPGLLLHPRPLPSPASHLCSQSPIHTCHTCLHTPHTWHIHTYLSHCPGYYSACTGLKNVLSLWAESSWTRNTFSLREVHSCMSLCISQDRLSYAAVTKEPHIQCLNTKKVYCLLTLHVYQGSTAVLLHINLT